jgi:uncharacterized protein (DUF58 family)
VATRGLRSAKLRSWLGGFTTRACCLLAAGATAALCGLLLGETDLVRAGGFAIAIPLVASVVVRRSQVNIASRRTVEPSRAPAGTPITVSLTVTNRSLLPTGTLMMEDTLTSHLRGRARFVLDGLGRRETRAVTYRIPPLPRGRYQAGPLRLRLSDPFRMVDLNRSFTTTSPFVLTPAVDALPGLALPRSWDIGDNLGSHSIGARGADDASTREYRRGDDLRKIHWRSTAKFGALMVRHEERPWQGHTVLVLDTRDRAHERSQPVDADTDPRDNDSLEWAISATASVATHLLANQREVSLVIGGAAARHSNTDAAALLDTLADVTPHPGRDLAELLDQLRDVGNEATVIAIVGRLDAVSLRTLTRVHPRGAITPALAIVLDTASWREPGSSDPSWANSAATLQSSGWTVARARSGDHIGATWAGLISQRSDRAIEVAANALTDVASAANVASGPTAAPIGKPA